MEKITRELERAEQTVKKLEKFTEKHRKVLERFPTLFLFLVTAGLVLVLHGFEQTFSQIPIFRDYPITMIVLGAIILLFTGRLYKRLDE